MADDAFRDQLLALGQYIRDRRQQAELSLRDLAERANVSNPYLSQLERGLHEPSIRVLNAIATALEVPIDALLAIVGVADDGGDESGTVSTEDAIRRDPALDEDQRQALLAVYRSYLEANARQA